MNDDIDFLGLRADDADADRFHFAVADHLARLDGRLYGGTAIAVSIATSEWATGALPLWMTTQFVATAPHLARVSVCTEVLAAGGRTNQVRVTGSLDGGGVVFASLGATGRYRENGLDGQFETPPSVSPPQASELWTSPFSGLAKFSTTGSTFPPFPEKTGFNSVIEIRNPEVLEHPDPGPGRLCLWIRRLDGRPITPAIAAYMADMVPLSVAHACEVVAGGTSLDNTIRIGAFVETEWILLDLRPHMAVGDYGHGAVHIWSQEGHLLATASQTASMIHFDFGPG